MKSRSMYVLGLVAILTMAAVSPLWTGETTAAPMPAEVWVDDDFGDGMPGWNTTRFDTIQAAVENVSGDGTVYVWAGTYVENVDVGRAMTIIGNGSAHCVVQAADASDHVFDLTANWVNLSGFNVTGATLGSAGVHTDPGVGVAGHCTIANMTAYFNAQGIWINNNCDYTTVVNNTAFYNAQGILMQGSCEHCVIANNTACGNIGRGLTLDTCPDNVIADNTLCDNGDQGFYSDGCSSNRFVNNTVAGNQGEGVYLRYCERWTVDNNSVCDNGYMGIRLSESHRNWIGNNTVAGNAFYGIYTSGSHINTLFNNTISSNENVGIWISSDKNLVYNNTVTGNNDGGPQAYDTGANNRWNSSTHGNRWGDYADRYVPPATNDGDTWDTPYRVEDIVGTGAYDYHPLADDTNYPPMILTLDDPGAQVDVLYEVTYPGYDPNAGDTLTWTFATNASWLSFNDATGRLSGTPGSGDVGTVWVNLTLEDGHGGMDYHNFTLWVFSYPVRNVNQGSQYTAIQDAIDDADPGDVIEILPDLYTGHIAVWQQITLRGRSPTVYPHLDGVGSASVVNVTADNVVLQYLNVTNGTHGVMLYHSDGSALTDSVIQGNDHGVYLDASPNATLTGNTVYDNRGVDSGIHIEHSDEAAVADSHVYDNDIGVYVNDSTNVTVAGTVVENNTVGIYTEGDTYHVSLLGNVVQYNEDGGIAGYTDTYLEAAITGNTITANGCSGNPYEPGGGIRLHGTDHNISVINATVCDNVIIQPPELGGGALRVGYMDADWINATTRTSHVTMTGNNMEAYRGGNFRVHAKEYLEVSASGNQFVQHEGSNKIGYAWGSTSGENVDNMSLSFTDNVFTGKCRLRALADSNITASVVGNTFQTVPRGGAVRLGWPGGITNDVTRNVTAHIADNVFTDVSGGAILTNATSHLDVEIYNNTLDNITCDGSRHAVEVASDATVHADIYGNTITDFNNTGIYVRGEPNSVTVHNNTEIGDGHTGIYLACNGSHIADNTVFNNTYGIYLSENTNHTTIVSNVVKQNDVGIYIDGGPNGTGHYYNGDTEIHWNQIYENDDYGVIYDIMEPGTPWVNATWNWWGAANGPFDPPNGGDGLYNPGGDGDNVTDYVLYDPWMGLYLYQGWNMVSPGFIPENGEMDTADDLADLIGANCTVVTRWDGDKQRYVSYVAGTGEGFSLRNGTGYFVFVTDDTNVQFTGGLASPDINLTLSDGFNLVGYPYLGFAQASDFAGDINNCVKVSMFDAETQTWLPEYITALPGISYNFDVLMGDGVFVFVNPGPVNWDMD